jgi:hypothetical protein
MSVISGESENKFKETVNIFQPKLLRLKNSSLLGTGTKQEREIQMLEYEKERIMKQAQVLNNYKKEISKRKNSSSEIFENNQDDNIKLRENIKSFYKNPFSYMDYLIETYCKIKNNKKIS